MSFVLALIRSSLVRERRRYSISLSASASSLRALGVELPDEVVEAGLLLHARQRLLVSSNAGRLGRGSLFRDRNEVCLALRATAAAFEHSPLLDQQRHMVDIALNVR
jgi:hypothetical protein